MVKKKKELEDGWTLDLREITKQCYRKFERLVDYLNIKSDKKNQKYLVKHFNKDSD